MIIGMIEN